MNSENTGNIEGKNKYLVMNLFWSMSVIIINCIVQFTITPYITNKIGIDAYGFVSLANSVMGYIDILAIAINAYASRFIAIEYHKQNINGANRFFSSVLFANLVLSICIGIPGSFLLQYIDKLIKIPDGLVGDVQILFILVFINYLFTVVASIYNVSTFIRNRLDLSSKQKTVATVLKSVVLLSLCMFLTPKVWYVTVATLISSSYILVTNIFYKRKMTPNLHFRKSEVSYKAIGKLISVGIWNSINNLGNTLNNGLDLLVSNLMIDATSMGQVAIGKNLATLLSTCISSICNAFQPVQLKLYAEGKKDKLIKDLKRSMRISGCFGNILVICIIVCGKTFLSCWLKDRQDISIIYNLFIMIFLAEVVAYTVRPLCYIYILTTKLKFGSFITIAEGIINVLLMIVFIRFTNLGVYAIVLSTLLLHNIFQFIAMPCYAAYVLKIRWSTFYYELIRILFAFGIGLGISSMIGNIIKVDNTWIGLIVLALIIMSITIVVQSIVILKKSERKSIIYKLINKVK